MACWQFGKMSLNACGELADLSMELSSREFSIGSGLHVYAEAMMCMQTCAMDESRDEDPTCTHSATSIHEEQTLERTGSMPERTTSMREPGRQSSAARKVQNTI